MEAIELMLQRESVPQLELPGPSTGELDLIFSSAIRAPDHGRLRPWRFIVIGEEKRAAFGALMANGLRQRDPTVSDAEWQRERSKAFRAPLIVVVGAKLQRGHKIPEVEQLASASAAAQTIMLAVPALGYSAIWKTGAPAYDPTVKTGLGLSADDEIIGFLYIGTRAGRPPQLPRPQAQDFVTVWEGLIAP